MKNVKEKNIPKKDHCPHGHSHRSIPGQ